jgi:hypothetical protein
MLTVRRICVFFLRLALDLSSLSGGAPGRTRGLKVQSTKTNSVDSPRVATKDTPADTFST